MLPGLLNVSPIADGGDYWLNSEWRASLRALVSRVRRSLARTPNVQIRSGEQWYQLVLPRASAVDCLVATQEIHDAEALLAVT